MKKFLLKLSYTVLPLWLAIVGCVFYISLWVSPRMSGDIGHLACIPFGHEYDNLMKEQMMKDTLVVTMDSTEALRSVHTDVLTIGDSFSQQQNGGYQNYLCSKGLAVANCDRYLYDSPLQYAYNLLDKGIVDSTNARVMVVENIERDLEVNIRKFSPDMVELPTSKPAKTAVKWSASRARDFIMYKLHLNTPVHKATLNADFFTSDEGNALYFYSDDISLGTSLSKDVEGKLADIFATLREKASQRGIRLILLIAVDKYDLYQSHITDNPFPQKTVCEDVERVLGENRDLVIVKNCLKALVDKGEKDVFLFNDSHWSYKASEAVADELFDRLAMH